MNIEQRNIGPEESQEAEPSAPGVVFEFRSETSERAAEVAPESAEAALAFAELQAFEQEFQDAA